MMLYDTPYLAPRYPAVAQRGMVATSQPLAVRAGLAMLEAGGNAVDAALAAAIMLTVVEPTSNGIGGDAFALLWAEGALHGLSGAGHAPAALTRARVSAEGHEQMPEVGWLPVTVPGAPDAWATLHERFGRLPFQRLFVPAIHAAEQGFAVSPVVAYYWARAAALYGALAEPAFAGWAPLFAPGGRAPQAGERWHAPEMAATLRRIAESRGRDFYEGALAAAIHRWAARTGGLLTGDDLAAHRSEWVAPIGATFRGHEVWEIPPPGQGLAALLALNVLEGWPLEELARDSVESFHLQIEALKLAFADVHARLADPAHHPVPTDALLAPAYAAERRALVGEQAATPAPGEPLRGGTVYLCAADNAGMMVSFIQSNYMGFGSGIVVPGTGIALHNRGAGFRLEAEHPNVVAPRKRPFHTIIPGFLTRDGAPVGPFGVMGAHMQPQGHVQFLLNTLVWGMNVQAALDAPRWRWERERTVLLEPEVAPAVVAGLRARGHEIRFPAERAPFGRGQSIQRTPFGTLVGATESRADGLALGW